MREGVRQDAPTDAVGAHIVGMANIHLADCKWELPNDFLQYSHFERVVMALDKTSSPGYPLMLRSPTNGALFKFDEDGFPDQKMMDYVWFLVNEKIERRDPADPIRLFIKAEPHKIKKIEEGRLRLISSVSLVDQIVDHMLFDSMNDKMVENWVYLPTKVGYAHVRGGWRSMPKQTWVASDKTGWDWSMALWVAETCLNIRAALCQTTGDQFQKWVELATYRYQQLYVDPTLMTSSGLLFKQLYPGVQKSGGVNTLADNSVGMWVLHVRALIELGLPYAFMDSMGDDVLQPWFSGFETYLEYLGQFCHIKQVAKVNEFAGFRFEKDGRIEPLYKGKHAYNILHADPVVLPSMALSYSILYHRSSDRDYMRGLFERMGFELFSLPIIDSIVDGME